MKPSLACAAACVAACVVTFPAVAIAQLPAGEAVPSGAAACIACHGAHGEGNSSGVPRLAGQDAEYLSHALSRFKAGTRDSPIMQSIAESLSEEQMREMAAFFSKQSAPLADAASTASPRLAFAGKRLAEIGTANVAACFTCHGAQGKGNGARVPGIAGQPARFVIDRLHEFQARARQKAPQPGSMTAEAAKLEETQIQEVAAYLSQLGS